MSLATLLGALALTTACTPAEMTASVIVSKPGAAQALVRLTDNLAPGDVVRVWRRTSCRHFRDCGSRQVARGVVTTVVLDSADYAFVDFAPGDDFAIGDRVSKDSPMFYWYPDPPPQ